MFKLTAFAIAGAAALAIASGAMAQTAAAPTTVNQILSQTYGPETLQNQPVTGGPDFNQGELIQVSGGCGPNGWRGPWGHCHYAHYWGPTWGGPYGPVRWNGCPQATGAALGVTAATRLITAPCPAAAGSKPSAPYAPAARVGIRSTGPDPFSVRPWRPGSQAPCAGACSQFRQADANRLRSSPAI